MSQGRDEEAQRSQDPSCPGRRLVFVMMKLLFEGVRSWLKQNGLFGMCCGAVTCRLWKNQDLLGLLVRIIFVKLKEGNKNFTFRVILQNMYVTVIISDQYIQAISIRKEVSGHHLEGTVILAEKRQFVWLLL